MTPAVLIVSATPYRSNRAAGIRLLHEVDALTLSGYAVELLLPPLGDPIYSSARQVHFPPRFPLLRGLPARRLSVRRAWYALTLLHKALRLALQRHYTLVLGIAEGSLAACLVAWFCRIPLIYEHPPRRPLGPLKRWIARRADLLLSPSRDIIPKARAIGLGSRVSYLPDIPSAIQPPSPAQVARAQSIWAGGHEKQPVIVIVGTRRDFPFGTLPEAIKQLYQIRPDIQYVFIGGTTRQIATLRRRLCQDTPELPARFSGCLQPESLSIALAASTFCILHLPPAEEVPMRLLDAYLASAPVLALGSGEEVALPGVRRCLDEPSEWVRAMVDLVDDGEGRARLAREGRGALGPERTPGGFAAGVATCCGFVLELHNRGKVGMR
ncbi:MAG: hypothetical protein SPK06_05580 [Kiritimatiellia bacterium]|nr:hypothetical protein [Kiritimatiellia bacterium]